jgi:glycosyltransferase involved in cell wall biosynthesis
LGRALGSADAVILQRRLVGAWQRFLLRRSAKTLIYDFDDAVFLRDSYARRGLSSKRRRRRFAALVRQADLVVAGNAFLAQQARQWAPTARVHIIPTCVDPARYPRAEHQQTASGMRLVWIGSSSTLQGLESIRPLLEAIGRQVASLRLKLICDRRLELEHLPVHFCPWSEGREPVDLATAEIGISYLPNDEWSRGKCGLKILQYMAAGLPVIANPVGVQKEMVRHGTTGFLVETEAQWLDAIRRLVADPGLRREMGNAGRRLLEQEWSVRAGAAQWIDLLDALAKRRQAA